MQEAEGLKEKFTEMERLAAQREAAAERLQLDLAAQRETAAAAAAARAQAEADAERNARRAAEELASRNRLNEALQVEVGWADKLGAKERGLKEMVRRT
jgi:hypothetical protein